MVYIVNDPSMRLSVPASVVKQLGALSPNSLQAISQVLASGKVLEVVIDQNRKSGQRGFYLFGNFIPATVPEQVRNGERLNLKVIEAGESLILKIVAPKVQEAPPQFSTMQEIVSDRSIQNLRSGINAARGDFPAGRLHELLQDPAQPTELKATAKKLLGLIDSLSEKRQIVAEKEIGSPAALQKALVELVSQQSEKSGKQPRAGASDEIKSAIKEISEYLKTHAHNKSLSIDSIEQATRALRQLESAIEGRQVLSKLNVIMANLGQASFVLLPAYTEGGFSMWEMQFDPNEFRNSGDGTFGGDEDSFHHLHLFLQFNSIGPVRADLAFRGGETLVRLTFGDDCLAQFVSGHKAALESALKNAGFESPFIVIESGMASKVAPQWLQKISALDSKL
ncbi:MAG: hypothetical protein J5J00_17260 [Deltaproteobacteria bacterium]|nr:hypothetical protein [Deltaproteobacteria bacterium]